VRDNLHKGADNSLLYNHVLVDKCLMKLDTTDLLFYWLDRDDQIPGQYVLTESASNTSTTHYGYQQTLHFMSFSSLPISLTGFPGGIVFVFLGVNLKILLSLLRIPSHI